MTQPDFSIYQTSADALLARIPRRPEIAVILGSALGSLADEMEDRVVVDYADVPHFLVSTAPHHAGQFVFGRLAGRDVVAMSGRFHSYEGYSFEELAIPVRVLKLLGVQTLIITCAAGAVNIEYNVGDIMVIEDHIKLTGASPMRGPNAEEFGPRFFDISQMYTPRLRQLALSCAERLGQGQRMRQGIYYFFTGPQYETPAEIRAVRTLGGDAVGMSIVTEALTAAHCGIPLLGLALMTNMAAGVLGTPLSEQEVAEEAALASGRFKALLREIVREI